MGCGSSKNKGSTPANPNRTGTTSTGGKATGTGGATTSGTSTAGGGAKNKVENAVAREEAKLTHKTGAGPASGTTAGGPASSGTTSMGPETGKGSGKGTATGLGAGAAGAGAGSQLGSSGQTTRGLAPGTPDQTGGLDPAGGAGDSATGGLGSGSGAPGSGIGGSTDGLDAGASGPPTGAGQATSAGVMGGNVPYQQQGSGFGGEAAAGAAGVGAGALAGSQLGGAQQGQQGGVGNSVGSGIGDSVGGSGGAGGVAPLSGRALNDVPQIPSGQYSPAGSNTSGVGGTTGGAGAGPSPLGTPTSGYSGGSASDVERETLLRAFEEKGITNEGRIEVINDAAVTVFSKSGHSEDETYLVSFMRTTDNMNINDASHKFSQIQRLLKSSGENWKQVLRTYLLP